MSQQSSFVIERRNFKKRWLKVGMLVLLIVMTVFLARWDSFQELRDSRHAIKTLTARVQLLAKENRLISDKLMQQERDMSVLLEAEQLAKSLNGQLQTQIYQQQKDIQLYQRVMGAHDAKQAIDIARFEVSPLNLEASRYQYEIALIQTSSQHPWVQGQLTATIKGQDQAGELQTLSLDTLSSSKITPVKFRYYQEITGDISFPDGFTPESMTLTLNRKGRSANNITKSFLWPLKEEPRYVEEQRKEQVS